MNARLEKYLDVISEVMEKVECEPLEAAALVANWVSGEAMGDYDELLGEREIETEGE